MKANELPVPTESEEQQALFRWAQFNSGKYPELRLMYHIPNEGKRSVTTGRRMRLEGLRSGVPDICIPVARGGYSALYVEMKRRKGGRVSDEQKRWLNDLNAAGNAAIVCRGWEEAAERIVEYLTDELKVWIDPAERN